MCTLALARYLAHPVGPLLTAEVTRLDREHIYQRSVFYVELWGRIEATAARLISRDDAIRFGQLHVDAYHQLGFDLIRVPPVTWRQG